MSVLACFVVPHPPLIIKEVGRGEENAINDTIQSYKTIAKIIADLKPETIILSSPHAPFYQDHFFISSASEEAGDLSRFGAPQVSLKTQTDTEFVKELCRENHKLITLSKDHALDHGSLVPLILIAPEIASFKLVRIGLSGLDRDEHIRLGQQIQTIAQRLNRRVVFIASGDLSHRLKKDGPYGIHPSGPLFDHAINKILTHGNFDELKLMDPELCEEAGECGYRSILIMSGVLSGLHYRSHLYSYEGPFGVGYACASYLLCDPIVDLAKLAIRNIVLNHEKTTVPLHTPQHLLETKAGVFVSIHKQGQLRGCIGTIYPTQPNVALEVITCAIWACTEDPRFSPVKANELEELEIHVDLLGSPEKINGPEALDIHRYGVIVFKGGRKGLLLPDLEGINSVSQQIAIALQKAGISPDEDYQLERFEVIRHHD